MTNHQAIQLLITGKVLGVGYRRWFEKEALRLQLLGYVRNLPTGEVEAVIMGQDSQLAEMIRHSYVGPLRAEVSNIQQHVLDPLPAMTDFKMLRG